MIEDTSPSPPGQPRLFQVEATGASRFDVVTPDGRLLTRTADLAAAVIAAASTNGNAWVVAPDRWAARITVACEGGWLVSGDHGVPAEAIHRVLALIHVQGEPS